MEPGIIDMNRRSINTMENWIDPVDYEQSLSRYGCPPRLLPLLNRPINDELTYTDCMLYAARRLGGPVSYLEIGVSVGKNFLALANGLENSRIVGLDWEKFNPAVARRLTPLDANAGSVSGYTNGKNEIRYVQGDIFEEASWRALQGMQFQLVFSDAAHHPHGVLHEFAMLQHYDLLDRDQVFILWDDLDHSHDGPMTQAFFDIARHLQARYGTGEDSAFLTSVNGWLGEHEHKHVVGVFNTLGITEADLQSIR